MGVPEGPCTELGSISTSHQQEWPSCHGYGRARLWAEASPGRSPRTPPVLTVEPGESLGHGGARGPPESRGSVPSGVSIHRGASAAYMALGQHRWPKVEGLATEDGLAGGLRCSWGSTTLICLAVQRAAGGRQLRVPWQLRPGLGQRPQGLPSRAGQSPQQAPWNLRVDCAFCDFPVCSCSV